MESIPLVKNAAQSHQTITRITNSSHVQQTPYRRSPNMSFGDAFTSADEAQGGELRNRRCAARLLMLCKKFQSVTIKLSRIAMTVISFGGFWRLTRSHSFWCYHTWHSYSSVLLASGYTGLQDILMISRMRVCHSSRL